MKENRFDFTEDWRGVTTGPILKDRCNASNEQCIRAQAFFIQYFVEEMLGRFLSCTGGKMPDCGVAGDSPEKIKVMRRYFQYAVVCKVAEAYREWFNGLSHTMTQSDFSFHYGQGNGPLLIFRELFPGREIEDFIVECFKEVEKSAPDDVEFRRNVIRALLDEHITLGND